MKKSWCLIKDTQHKILWSITRMLFRYNSMLFLVKEKKVFLQSNKFIPIIKMHIIAIIYQFLSKSITAKYIKIVTYK